MSPLNLFSGLLVSTCLAGILPTSMVLAQSTEPVTENLLLAQASSSDTLNNLEEQPDGPEDLEIDGLTNDQAAQIVAIFDTYQPQIDTATVNYLEALVVLNDLLAPDTSDLALTNAHSDVAAAEQVLNDAIFNRNLALRSVLTLEQRQVINDYIRAYLGIGSADPMVVFPMNLVGTDARTTIANLEADGWVPAFNTPGEVGLDRGNEKLNLGINRSGEIVTADLVD
jgi:Spy/CpxP family protein refolding chaperone